MNEVPRWSGGYGFQIFQEFRWSKILKNGRDKINNSDDLFYQKHITHFEGVYTWRKWIRVTLKAPLVYYDYRLPNSSGRVERQTKEGFGNIILAVPLKYYMNKKRWSGHVGFTPQIRFGGNSSGSDNEISDGSTDFGASLSFEKETAFLKIYGGTTYWFEQASGQKDELKLDFGVGWNFHDRGSISFDVDYVDEKEDHQWLGAGFSFFWNFNDIVMARIEYKHALFEYEDRVGITTGNVIRLGIGFVF
ncbi:MAG: hypothetical protein COA79_08715 [Planctomycetota bacterium]|nr:MAG: hypothetical protein COA79_08715 [Planctomycetota bacterium]